MDITNRLKETSSWMNSMFDMFKDPHSSEVASFSSRVNTPLKSDIKSDEFLNENKRNPNKELLKKQLFDLKAKRQPKEKLQNINTTTTTTTTKKEKQDEHPIKKLKTTDNLDKKQPNKLNNIVKVKTEPMDQDNENNNDEEDEDDEEEEDEDNNNKQSKKRKLDDEEDDEEEEDDDDDDEFDDYSSDDDDDDESNEEEEEEEKKDKKKEKKAKIIKEEDLQFSTFDFSTGKPIPTYLANKGKISKADQLKKAEERDQVIKNVKKTGVGKDVVVALKWSNALDKVNGVKTKDNVALIKKTMKKKLKRKMKSAKEWSIRKKEVKEKKDTRIQRREDNIKAKLDKAKDRRMGIKKKNKPSHGGTGGNSNSNSSSPSGKKPLKRAGFEGKKKQFFNSKSK